MAASMADWTSAVSSVPQMKTAAGPTVVAALSLSVTWVTDWYDRIVVERGAPAVPAPSTRICLPTSVTANVDADAVRMAAPEVMAPFSAYWPSPTAPYDRTLNDGPPVTITPSASWVKTATPAASRTVSA